MGNIPISLRMMNHLNNLGKSEPAANINTVLPPELLEMVLRYLPPSDLRNAMLVCHQWREVGQAPRFWREIFSRATYWWLARARENTAPAVAVPASRRGTQVREITVEELERDPQNPFLVKKKLRASINKLD